VAQPLRLNFRCADPSRLFEGPEGQVARTPSEKMNWVAHTSGLRVGVLVSLFPVLSTHRIGGWPIF
jgi:hypothetical protein